MDFNVPDMSCGHCTAAIEKSIKATDPAATVQCDLNQRRVRINSHLGAAQLSAAITKAGYDSELVTA